MTRGLAAGYRAAVLVSLAFAASAAQGRELAASPNGLGTALVFRAESLQSGGPSLRWGAPGARSVFRSDLAAACLGVAMQPADLAVYFTRSRTCLVLGERAANPYLDGRTRAALRQIAVARAGLLKQLEHSPLVALQPDRPAAIEAPAALCICTGNEPPVANVVSGSPQTVDVGAAIATISFAGTDSDTATLSHAFSYTQDGGSAQPGLPGAMTPSCVSGNGFIDCTVDGTAPAQAGSFVVRFEVSDGESTAEASAVLGVVEPQPVELIHADGFEGT